MNGPFVAISILLCLAQFFLPRKYGFLPLIIVGAHLSAIEILPELSPARLVIFIGLFRAFQRDHLNFSFSNPLDRAMVFFGLYLSFSGIFHTPSDWIPKPFLYRVGLAVNLVGTYAYGKSYIDSFDAIKRYAIAIPFVLLPLCIGMTMQKSSGSNPYSIIGSAGEFTLSRLGELRASGPFRHAILAGCAGTTALPFALFLWRQKKRLLAIGLVAIAIGIVKASASSGPLAAAGVSMAAIPMWYFRHHMPKFVFAGVIFGLLYWVANGRGPWFIMAGMDLVGGSTGWHRAELINQSLFHLNEWFFWGSDYTRHWMSTGMRATPDHSDLTNYYIHMGVLGGLPVTLLIDYMILKSLKMCYDRSKEESIFNNDQKFIYWGLATAIATHALMFVSISYFDQMYIFFYIILGAAISICQIPIEEEELEYANQPRENSLEKGPVPA